VRARATTKFKPSLRTVLMVRLRRKQSAHSMVSESAHLIGRRRGRCIHSLNESFPLKGRRFSAETLGAAGWAEAIARTSLVP
jgi:hypothetical protein